MLPTEPAASRTQSRIAGISNRDMALQLLDSSASRGRWALAPLNCVPYDASVFGHLLPRQMQLASNPERDEEQLRAVMMQMTPTTRRLILHGLVRPNAILIGSYSAPGHRCCPLASAVWEATGSEATSFESVMAGITELGFEPDHQEFIAAFDTWASGYETYDTDGLARVLSGEGRSRLIRLIEQLPHD